MNRPCIACGKFAEWITQRGDDEESLVCTCLCHETLRQKAFNTWWYIVHPYSFPTELERNAFLAGYDEAKRDDEDAS